MSFLKKIYYRAASAVPARFLLGKNLVNILLPYQHLVSDEHVRHVRHLYPYKNKKQFTRDLDYLLTHFHVVDPGTLIESLRLGRPVTPGGFLLSFDDGLREVHDVVAPILRAKGVPAMIFLTPLFLDNQALFYRSKLSLVIDELLRHPPSPGLATALCQLLGTQNNDPRHICRAILQIQFPQRQLADRLGDLLEISFREYLEKYQPYLGTGQIRELLSQGFYVGGHSMDHPNYRFISLAEQLKQTQDSCRFVRDRFGLSYSIFSFPHEDKGVGQEFFDQALIQDPPVDAMFGTQNQKLELANHMLHRFNAERPEYPIEGLIKGILLYHVKTRVVSRSPSGYGNQTS